MALGLACRVDGSQAIIAVVRLGDGTDAPIDVLWPRYRTSQHQDLSQQLLNLHADLIALVDGAGESVAVVRTIERWGGGRQAPRDSSTRLRLWVEGVLLAACRAHVPNVTPMTGQEIGTKVGKSQADVETEAQQLSAGQPVVIDATCAAIAARRIASEDSAAGD